MPVRTLFLALILVVLSAPISRADEISDVTSDIENLKQQIIEAEASAASYEGGAIRALILMRLETLKLGQTLLENKVRAMGGEGIVEVEIPVTKPNAATVERLVSDISEAQQRVSKAAAEAEAKGGLVGALAKTRLETEKLTLAQLQMAYFQAQYGLAVPQVSAVTSDNVGAEPIDQSAPDEEKIAQEDSENVDDQDGPVAWADPDYPNIDYSILPFQAAHTMGNKIDGWWITIFDKADLDDSPQVVAINLSEYEKGVFPETSLMARCIEGNTSVIYNLDEYLLTSFRRSSFDVKYRIDDSPAVSSRWSELTTKKGAGLFRNLAIDFLRDIKSAKSLFIRLIEKNGEQHDANFDLSGIDKIIGYVSEACAWSPVKLTAEDYKAIQTLLNAGGYEAGTPDGKWGPGSTRAMKAFQEAKGLKATGVPDQETLGALGF